MVAEPNKRYQVALSCVSMVWVLTSVAMISNNRAIAGLRVAVGALFLIFAEYKVLGREFMSGGGFQHWINRFLEDGAYPFMAPVLRNFVLPHARGIAFLVAYGELAIGLALVLGILVRPASVCGVIYMLALLFASNYPGPHAAFWQYFGASLDHLVLAFCFATFMVGRPEETWSVGAYLRRRVLRGGRIGGGKSATTENRNPSEFGN